MVGYLIITKGLSTGREHPRGILSCFFSMEGDCLGGRISGGIMPKVNVLGHMLRVLERSFLRESSTSEKYKRNIRKGSLFLSHQAELSEITLASNVQTIGCFWSYTLAQQHTQQQQVSHLLSKELDSYICRTRNHLFRPSPPYRVHS